MANYKESTISGASWVRCRTVTITNPLAGTELPASPVSPSGPTAYFQEEKVMQVDGQSLRLDSGSCHKEFAADGTIAMRDPSTGELTGESTTHGALYAILFSLYMQTATERDAAG